MIRPGPAGSDRDAPRHPPVGFHSFAIEPRSGEPFRRVPDPVPLWRTLVVVAAPYSRSGISPRPSLNVARTAECPATVWYISARTALRMISLGGRLITIDPGTADDIERAASGGLQTARTAAGRTQPGFLRPDCRIILGSRPLRSCRPVRRGWVVPMVDRPTGHCRPWASGACAVLSCDAADGDRSSAGPTAPLAGVPPTSRLAAPPRCRFHGLGKTATPHLPGCAASGSSSPSAQQARSRQPHRHPPAPPPLHDRESGLGGNNGASQLHLITPYLTAEEMSPCCALSGGRFLL